MISTRPFLDTNILIYALLQEGPKSDRARALMTGRPVVSVQVLNELVDVAVRKYAISFEDLGRLTAPIQKAFHVVELTLATHGRACELGGRYGYQIYDSLILASALAADCDVLFTEDLDHGQSIENALTIRNPFL